MYKLTRIEDSLTKSYPQVKFITWNDLGRAEEIKDTPSIGDSCILGPLSVAFTWQTTPIKNISLVEYLEDGLVSKLHFSTLNSNYILEWSK